MTVLLTGATGFIGRHLLERLCDSGEQVRVLIREARLESERAERDLEEDGVDVVAGSVTDRDDVELAVAGVDAVYHFAGVLPGRGDADEIRRVTIDSMDHLLSAGERAGVRRIVFASSCAVYAPGAWPLDEDARLAGSGPYARAKLDAEELMRGHAETGSVEPTILRLWGVYGVDAPFFQALATRALLRPFGAGTPRPGSVLQWVHVRDVVAAAMLAGTLDQAGGGTFNIAGANAMTWARMVRTIRALHHRRAAGWFQPGRRGPELPRLAARRHGTDLGATEASAIRKYDIGKAEAVLGWEPQVPLEEGLAELVRSLEDDETAEGRGWRTRGRMGARAFAGRW
jgi:UDP-glucose 4-epimerase